MVEKKEQLKSLGKGEHGEIWAQWHFPEFFQYERTFGWYFLMGLFGLGLIIWSIATGNFLFAVIIILAVIIIFLHSRRQPSLIDFKITQDGLEIGQKFYEWREVESFWIIYKPPEVKRLYFKLKAKISPYLSVPLEKQNPLVVRRILLKYCQENLTKDDEGIGDYLSRSLKI